MSLLLDARRKSQQAQSQLGKDGSQSGSELSLESLSNPAPASAAATYPTENSRAAGQNLFSAKSPSSPLLARARRNRNLLVILAGAILLFAAGAGYVWHATQPPVVAVQLAKPAQSTPPQNNLVPDIASTQVVASVPASSAQTRHASRSAAKSHRQAIHDRPALVEQHQEEPIDPILNNAYLAYRGGKFDQAQQLYREVNNLDARNMDAILGLAAIAQRRGEDSAAAHYYAQALALDPRNAVANAGMSALTTGDNRESRLKTLLNEQPDSSTLYFALGNRYAEQARWGEAQQAYFNAYKLEPGNAELAFNLAISLDRLGQYKPAAQYYQRALQLDPDQSAGIDHKQISQRIEDLSH
jgi:tetratricopeptide (TPR) repeat protein